MVEITNSIKEITRIGGIATLSNDGRYSYIALPKSWNRKRVFALLKEAFDIMEKQQEKANVKTVGTFATALIEGGKKCKN